jgi:deazaflavin-dependent oxidoreductase (nitroreductase family)
MRWMRYPGTESMWYNSIIRTLLRSRLHGMMSKNTMLITYTGRRSGKTYTTPVNYVRNGDDLLVVSYRRRTWWRNLGGGAPVTVRVQGRDLQGVAEAITDDDAVAAGLMDYLGQTPQWAKYFDVGLNADGQPEAAEVARAARERVMVRVQLAPAASMVL